jgi:putative sterol carrier protein
MAELLDPISDSPDASIRLDAEQAEAIRRGELHPVEALITGQLRLEGDLGLIIQLQAIAMLASPPPSTTTSPLG